MKYYAHTHDIKNWQPLSDHLINVSEISSSFSSKFKNKDWGELQGLLHDFGKYKNLFQKYLKGKILSKTDHATIGGIYAINKFNFIGKILAYTIVGHHSGLPDYYHNENVGGSLLSRINKKDNINSYNEILNVIEDEVLNKIKTPNSKPIISKTENIHIWIRMLYSCLVDADYIDTEQFMNETTRDKYNGIDILYDKFNSYMNIFLKNCNESKINKLRTSVLNDCIIKGKSATNKVYTLTVPTGLGKTKSSMAFALECCKSQNKDRIIIGIPFISIIEQTAKEYKEIFGNNVLEHHSNIELNYKDRLASENWDIPIIVTTNIQLFESLFASKSSKCRKLHNIVNSVIILDEAHQIPFEYMKPIIKYLKCLVEDFNCTLVLSSATQPILNSNKYFDGFNTTEIISNVDYLFKNKQKINININKEFKTFEQVAKEIKKHRQVLCIVNTKNNCRHLYDLIDNNSYHLSSYMCPKHRSKILKIIKQKLKNNEEIKVISTQLIECGVDIDFPVVYRELSGLDNIAQAAGRCNREGNIDIGLLNVFKTEYKAPKGLLRKSQDAMIELLNIRNIDLSNESISSYFNLLYNSINSFDSNDICKLLESEAFECKIQFRTADKEFNIIKNNFNILTYYDEGDNIISKIKNGIITKKLLRKAQQFSISVYENEFEDLKSNGDIECINDIWYLKSSIYNDKIGLCEHQAIYKDNALFV